MRRSYSKSMSTLTRLQTGMLTTAFALGVAAAGPASAATKEIDLATPAQALAYCQSGKMPGSDIAYIAGGPRLVQYGPSASCKQAVTKKIDIRKAILASGKHVAECNLSAAAAALTFCNDGGMGTYDIAYINGKIGHTINGLGYGCNLNFSTSSIGNAICR